MSETETPTPAPTDQTPTPAPAAPVSFARWMVSGRFLPLVVAGMSFLLGIALHFVWILPEQKPALPEWHDVSVMVAVGNGFKVPVAPFSENLQSFLNGERKSLSVEDAAGYTALGEPWGFHAAHRYLFSTIGAVWWLLGISWNALAIFQSLMLGITALILYGLFRLGMNRWISAAGALLFVATPIVLYNVPFDRDFSKAPFVLGCILILGHLAKKDVSWPKHFLLAALAGLVAGIGLGFREDMTLCLPATLVVLAFCPRPAQSRGLLKRGMAIGLMLFVWFLAAQPILGVLASNKAFTFHSLAGGLGGDNNLPVEPGSTKLLRFIDDLENSATYSSHAIRTAGARATWEFFNDTAEERARRFFFAAVCAYPADFVNRSYAALLQILSADWNFWHTIVRLSRPMMALGRAQELLTGHWLQYRLYYVGFAFAALAFYGGKTACLALFLLLYFGCTLALQFQFRHAFHLYFLPLWFMGFALDKVLAAPVRVPFRLFGKNRIKADFLAWRANVVLVFFLVAACVILTPLYAARLYQAWVINASIPRYAQAELEPVSYVVEPAKEPGMALVRVKDWPWPDAVARDRCAAPAGAPASWEDAVRRVLDGYYTIFEDYGKPRLWSGYLVADFEVDDAGIQITPQYDGFAPNMNTPTEVRAVGARQPVPVRQFTPIYETTMLWYEGRQLAGLLMAEKDVPALKGMYRMKSVDGFRFLPYVALPADRTYFRGYSTLRGLF